MHDVWEQLRDWVRVRLSLPIVIFALLVVVAAPRAFANQGDPAIGSLVDVASKLLESGDATQAYALLAPREIEFAGHVEFDYLLGIAALRVGKPDKATWTLERVLTLKPEFVPARLAIAQSYFALGNLAEAKTEFEQILALAPSPEVEAWTQKYLALIAEPPAPAPNSFLTGYAQMAIGYDSNVNASTDEGEVFVPRLGTLITLSPDNTQTGAFLGAIGAGVNFGQRITDTVSMFANANAGGQHNVNAEEFDTNWFNLRTGVTAGDGKNDVTLGLEGGRFGGGSYAYRNAVGVNVQWSHRVSAEDRFVMSGAYSLVRYPDLSVNNYNQILGAVFWEHALRRTSGNPVLTAGGYIGWDHDAEHRADGGQRFIGLRFGARTNITDTAIVYANLGGQIGPYLQENAAFLVTREDRQIYTSAGINVQLDQHWSLEPQISLFKQYSNITVDEYDRARFFLTLRRDFR